MDFIAFLFSLASGAAGGSYAASVLKHLSFGTIWNAVAGVVGGGLAGKILTFFVPALAAQGGFDLGALFSQLLGGGIGGGVLMAIAGLLRREM